MSIPTPESAIPPYNASGVSQEDRTMAMLAYILAIFTSFIGPLVLWLIKKDQSKFVAFHAMQALVLMGAVFLVSVAGNILSVFHLGLVGLPFACLAGIAGLVLNILAAIAANKGDWYEMPIVGKYARQFAGI